MVFAIFLGAEVFTVSSTAQEEFTVSVVTEQVVFATKFIEIVVAMAIRQELLVVFVSEFIIEVVVVTGVDTTFTMVVATSTITIAIVVHIVVGTTNST